MALPCVVIVRPLPSKLRNDARSCTKLSAPSKATSPTSTSTSVFFPFSARKVRLLNGICMK